MSHTAPSPSPSTSSTSEESSFSSSSSSHLNSPSLLTTDLGMGLDPADALELLLKSAGQNELPDWSELSSLWNGTEQLGNPYSGVMDFASNMSIDPSALHYNPATASLGVMSAEQHYPFTYHESHFPYPFHGDMLPTFADSLAVPQQRRLSVTSSSSSSGASLSPVLEHSTAATVSDRELQSTPPSVPASATDELAQLVRMSSGVLHAVPVGSQIGGHGLSLTVPTPESQEKAILILPRPTISTSSSPSPAQQSSSSESVAQVSASGRPKTSHTTIERRYRTNLNARIQSLRMAVPALRVLDRKNGKSAKNSKQVEKAMDVDKMEDDVIDDRGFVDGVRVARKCSKANVLGKAVEYIRVLKKREKRLKNEQDGLKSLLSGLVGGADLLREWERVWTAKFGGPEKDELEESELVVRVTSRDAANKPGDFDGSDGEDDDDDEVDDDGSDEEGGRKRKKIKTSPAPKAPSKEKVVKIQPRPGATASPTTVLVPGALPEKRKRGRPRKNPLPPAAPTPMPIVAHPVTMVHTSSSTTTSTSSMKVEDIVMQPPSDDNGTQKANHPQQYLLATFALFSFFNSPLTSTSPSPGSGQYTEHGHVLNPLPNTTYPDTAYGAQAEWGWQEVIQSFHLLVSALVFASVVLPWVPWKPRRAIHKINNVLHKVGLVSKSGLVAEQPPVTLTLAEALAPARRGMPSEADGLRNALNAAKAGSSSLRLWRKMNAASDKGRGFERKGLEQRAWVRLGELAVLGGPSQVSLYTRIQTYIQMRTYISWLSASASDHITLALLAHDIPIFGRKNAIALWEGAREKAGLCAGIPEKRSGLVNDGNRGVREYEKLVLRDLEVGEAAKRLRELNAGKAGKRERYMLTPLGALAGTLVKERTKKHLMMQFISTVVPPSSTSSTTPVRGGQYTNTVEPGDLWDEETAVAEKRKTIDAARSLGGSLAELGDILERLQSNGDGLEATHNPTNQEDSIQEGINGEIRSLLNAILLYRKIFPSSILSHSKGLGHHDATSSGAQNCSGVSILLSPPPSPSQKDIRVVYALRRALGNAVFDCNTEDRPKAEGLVDCADERKSSGSGSAWQEDGVVALALEDARDRVVDMLVELEMEGNGRVRS
ncbi:BHLH domain-containing protein [Pleurotus pulmonarius]